MKNLFPSPYFTPEYKILNYSAVIILRNSPHRHTARNIWLLLCQNSDCLSSTNKAQNTKNEFPSYLEFYIYYFQMTDMTQPQCFWIEVNYWNERHKHLQQEKTFLTDRVFSFYIDYS